MDQKKIERINELAHKAKTVGLTEEEKAEREVLRNEYRASFRANVINTMEHTVIERPDGSREPVRRKPDAKC